MNTRDLLKKLFFPIVAIVRTYRTYKVGIRIKQWRNIVLDGELLVKMDKPNGKFYVDARSHLINGALNGAHEIETINLIHKLKLKDGIIVNIGANIGFYAIELSNIFPNKKILAIEPNPEAFSLLVKNININNLSNNIEAINVCISNINEIVPFSIIPGKSEYSSINGIVMETVKNEKQTIIDVESKLLGDIVSGKKVSLIFMDVEGAEKMVLDGCLDLILKDKPIIICECSNLLLKKFKSSSLDLINTLEKLNYKINPFKSFTGERSVKRKDILPILGKMKNSKFGIETLINLYFQATGKIVKYVLPEMSDC